MTIDDFVLVAIPAFLRRFRKGAALGIVVLVALLLLFAYVLYAYPAKDIGPEQPIPFSHRIHAGVKQINCRFCHSFVERSARAGIPEVGKCLYCHNFIIPWHPQIRKEHAYYDRGEPVPWKRVFYAYDYVQFRHQPHILRGFDCKECHGDVATMDRLPRVEFKMGFCIDCHRKNQASTECWLACHS